MERDIDILITKARMGDITPEEKQRLQQALLGLSPSSPEFQRISSVIKTQPTQGGGIGNPLDFFTRGWGERRDNGRPENPLEYLPVFSEGGAFSGGVPGIEDIMWGRSTPTLDFLSDERGNKWTDESSTKTTPAEASDIQGSAPIGSGTTMPENADFAMGKFDMSQPSGKFNIDTQDSTSAGTAYLGDPESILAAGGMPQGFSFSDMNRTGIENLQDPNQYARHYASQQGRPGAAEGLVDPVKAAMAMAATGIIGPGMSQRGDSLQGGIGLPEEYQLQAVEELMDQYHTKGTVIDPAAIYNQMFERASNTDLNMLESPQTGLPMTEQEKINYTNASLQASAPFMSAEGQAWISSLLTHYGNEYMEYIGSTDEVEPMSYPAFLKSQGVDQLLSGQ